MSGARVLPLLLVGAVGCARGTTSSNPIDDVGDPARSADAGSNLGALGSLPEAGGTTGDGGDAAVATAVKPAAGDVLISEVMYNPSGVEPDSEWIEIANISTGPRTLTGLTLKDGGDRTHLIEANVVVAPGAFVVLARSTAGAAAAKVPATAVGYEYGAGLGSTSGIILANGAAGSIALLDGSKVLVRADYGAFTLATEGKSVQLATLTVAASTKAASWCVSEKRWATGAEMGTPGAAPDCP